MTTPPPGPGASAALNAIAMQLAALLHQQQVYNNLPSSSAQAMAARQAVTPQPPGSSAPPSWVQGLTGGATPPPAAPTVGWLQQAAQSLISQVVLNQPRRSGGTATTVTPPSTPQGGVTGTSSAYPAMMMPTSGGVPNPWGGMPAMVPSTMFYPGASSAPPVSSSHGGAGSWNTSTGVGRWARSSLPRIGAAVGGPWGAVAGAAIAASTQVPAEVRSQRDKNAFYQSIEGGSNASGFGERLSEEGYRWSTFGVLSSQEARQAFKGVTKLGFNSKVEGGPGRQDALDFVYHGKTSYGATVDESLQEIQVATQSALTNFKDLSKALKDVSDSAGKAGVNAQMARGEFTQLMDTAIKTGYGSSSADVAQLEQQTKNSYGRSFQGVDVSGRLSQSHAVMASSLSGISVAQYMTGGAGVKGAADAKLDAATVDAILKPGVADWVKEQINDAGGNVGQDIVQQIAEEMLRQFYPNDLQALGPVVASISGNSGLTNDPVKAAMWIVQQYNGKGAAETAKTIAAGTNKTNQQLHDRNRPQSGTYLMQHDRGRMLTSTLGTKSTAATRAYQDWSQSAGTDNQDLVIRNLLKDVDDDKTQVAVTTKSGKRVVSLADAIKNHRNELATGKAVIVSGDQAGKSVKDVVGADNVDPLRDYSKEAAATDNSGMAYDTWTKKNSTSAGKLQIGLTPDARRLLTVLDNTGVAGSAATATPPQSPYASNPSYNGG
ncbi:hypothetical protein ACFZAM_31310 [Streptomyces sp. NPDC008079]|uniref:hypothetical protein n=1 Tax=Streptomyces sp. NPDC008079 TaxID=3364806 RepID=UPI0036ECA3BE